MGVAIPFSCLIHSILICIIFVLLFFIFRMEKRLKILERQMVEDSIYHRIVDHANAHPRS